MKAATGIRSPLRGRSVTNICAGSCVIMSSTRPLSATACGVTPHAQKTGISCAEIRAGSPESGRLRSAIPIAFGSPTAARRSAGDVVTGIETSYREPHEDGLKRRPFRRERLGGRTTGWPLPWPDPQVCFRRAKIRAVPWARSDELAAERWHDRFLLGNHAEDLVLAVMDFEHELAQERLMVFFAEHFVALREVVALLHLQTLESIDELHCVLLAVETRLRHADLERVHCLVVRLHVAVRQRARGIDLLQALDRLVEEALMVRRVQHPVEDRHVAVDAYEALCLDPQRG